MGEWLTIGQLIDSMKVGDIAVSDTQVSSTLGYRYIKRESIGFYVGNGFSEEDVSNYRFMELEEGYFKFKWKILPRYVSFEEAKKAYHEGKTIVSVLEGHVNIEFNKKLDNERLINIKTKRFFEGKWMIKD
jgi:hypothetical protein